jgi:hypothetical protein
VRDIYLKNTVINPMIGGGILSGMKNKHLMREKQCDKAILKRNTMLILRRLFLLLAPFVFPPFVVTNVAILLSD